MGVRLQYKKYSLTVALSFSFFSEGCCFAKAYYCSIYFGEESIGGQNGTRSCIRTNSVVIGLGLQAGMFMKYYI